MNQEETSCVVAYRRRALCTKSGLALLSVSLAFALSGAKAQDTIKTAPDSAKTGQANKPPVKNGKDKKGGVIMHVIPVPRKDAGKAAPPPADGKRVITPGDAGRAAIPLNVPGNGTPVRTVSTGNNAPMAATPFSFDFRGSDINNVLKFYSQVSGLTITGDPSLSGAVTIICPKQVSLDEAFKILQAVLGVRGFTAQQNGNVMTIVPVDVASKQTTIIGSEIDEDGTAKLDPRNQVMTQVIPLENVDADATAKELTPLISKGASLIGSTGTNSLILTDTASNIQRFITLVTVLDKTSNNQEMKIYQLKRAEASAIADIINNIYKQITTRGRGGGQPGQPGQPQFQQPGQPQPAAGARPSVVAVPDTRTNTVIVIASPDTQEKIATTIINRLDDDESNTLETRFRKIKYADATNVANQVNTVLNNSRISGAGGQQGGSSFQSRAFGGFFGFGFGGNNNSDQQTVTSTDPFGKVAADARTNSVLITASAERRQLIDQLIDQLDVDVPVESTTFVFPLKNAQAADVAYALSQAFGTGNQNGLGNFNSFNINGGGNSGTGRQRQPIQRRLGSGTGIGGLTGRAASRRNIPPGPPNAPDNGDQGDDQTSGNGGSAMPQGVQGVMTPNGFVPTATDGSNPDSERTRQFFFGGRGGFGGRQALGQSGGAQYGRGRNGNFSNLLQLQNNVYVTPSPNGDAIIVTTTPDNYRTLQEIIDALDVIPRQVMIEVVIAEVTLDQDEKLGFALGGRFANLFNRSNNAQGTLNLPASGSTNIFDAAANGAQFVLNSANYNALLQAFKTDSKVKVLATPSVFASNNQPADIEITSDVYFVSGQIQSNGLTNNVVNQLDSRPVGFILNVTPRITRQGLVTIDVTSEASDLVRLQNLGTAANPQIAPLINTRYTDTSVTAQDGETIAIGGLIRENKQLNINKVPILSEIPLIGQFFRSRETVRQKVELMIFMTPHVVNSVEEAREFARKSASSMLPQIPDLGKQQPNLLTPKPPKDAKTKGTSPTNPNGDKTPSTGTGGN